MDWLLLMGLGIIWAAFLIPGKAHRRTVEGFERDMDMLSHLHRAPGRWVIMPRREERFLGPHGRARARARDRRRRVLTVLAEALGVTALIGAFPPLRAMWVISGLVAALLLGYVWLLVQVRAQPSRFLAPATGASRPSAEEEEEAEEPAFDPADAGVRLLAR